MKKLLMLFVCALMCVTIWAQAPIDDRGGVYGPFDVLSQTAVENNVSFTSYGLYTEDGSTLVKAFSNGTYYGFFVKEGTLAIADFAIPETTSRVYIPSSVMYISPKAFFHSPNVIIAVYSGSPTTSVQPIPPTPNGDLSNPSSEASRYTIDGIKIDHPTEGINIVTLPDGTARKEVVR